MRNGTLALVLSLSAAAACGGSSSSSDAGGGGSVTPTANGVFPTQGFAGRTVHVEVSGDDTNWDATATLDFGSGVTAANVTVASPTDLEADLTIDGAATLGARDVTVTSNGTFTLKQAFSVTSPVQLTFLGDVTQGGIPFFTISNLDIDNPFDATTGTDEFGDTIFTNIQVMTPDGVDMTSGISAVTELSITGRAFIDTTATAGPVTIVSGPTGGTQVTSAAGTAMVTARTPVALTAGSDTTGMIAGPGDSALFSLAATGSASLLNFTISSTDDSAQPASGVLPDGTWANAIGAPSILNAPATLDIVVGDAAEYGGYSFTINATADTLTTAAEGNDTSDNTNALTTNTAAATALPFEMTAGTLSSATDVDVIKLTNVPAGKHIHVTTELGPDSFTDTQVDIQNSVGTSIVDGGGPVDGGETGGADEGDTCAFEGVCGEDVDSDATAAAGTFFVQISAGADFSTDDEGYVVVISLD